MHYVQTISWTCSPQSGDLARLKKHGLGCEIWSHDGHIHGPGSAIKRHARKVQQPSPHKLSGSAALSPQVQQPCPHKPSSAAVSPHFSSSLPKDFLTTTVTRPCLTRKKVTGHTHGCALESCANMHVSGSWGGGLTHVQGR